MTGRTFKPGHVALERALSKLGIASRTVARKWILAGKVRVNGVIRRDPLFAVVPERAKIEIAGERVGPAVPRSFVLYKPRGVVTTRRDEKGRPDVFSLIKEDDLHLIAVGRLDMATTGLLILTNDTQLSAYLTDPTHGILRTYLVTVRGQVTEAQVQSLRQGLILDGEKLSPEDIVLRKSSGRESHLTVQLTEGKNREIRRLFSAIGHEVTKLKRVAFGELELGQLKPGEYRELTSTELARLRPKRN